MVNMDVQIINISRIIPSLPTPSHLKSYKLSLLDQFEPSAYIGTILFYHPPTITPHTSTLLKYSLSETLSRFYPVAGKIKDKFCIDCTDEGVYYTEAKSNISLFRYLDEPDYAELHKLMPNATCEADLPSGSPVGLIQETQFIDGGFSIGMYLSHMVGDGYSMFLFMKEWAAAAAAKSALRQPFLGGESIFPQFKAFPNGLEGPLSLFTSILKKGNYVTKRFVFNESAIANLKANQSLRHIRHLTRFEIVTAVLSKWLMDSFTTKTGTQNPLLVSISMDLRRRAQLPSSAEYAFGNYLRAAGVLFTGKEKELGEFVNQLRRSMKNVDKNFINKIKNGGEDGYLKYFEALKELSDLNANSSPIYVALSSLCHFDDEVLNFGWGMPIWKGCFTRHVEDSNMPFLNTVILMDTRNGKGVDAWLCLDQNEFEFPEKGSQIFEYVSVDASPLYTSAAETLSKV